MNDIADEKNQVHSTIDEENQIYDTIEKEEINKIKEHKTKDIRRIVSHRKKHLFYTRLTINLSINKFFKMSMPNKCSYC